MKSLMLVAVVVVVTHAAPQARDNLPQSQQVQQSQQLELPQLRQPQQPQQPPQTEERREGFPYPPQPFSFKFNIADGVEGVRFAHVGEGDALGRVQGSYSYVRPDGVLFTVRYTADETGFHPELIEEAAPAFEHDPERGTATYTVALPYTDEFGVKVTAQQLNHYKEKAALASALSQ